MRKKTRRRNQKEDPSQLILVVVISTIFLLTWNQLFPPPVPVQPNNSTPSTEQQKQGLNAGSKIQQGESILPSVTSILQSASHSKSKTLPELKALKSLYIDDVHELWFNNHGQIHAWSLLESQYQQSIKSTEELKGQVSAKKVPYKLANLSFEDATPFLPPLLEVYLNDTLVELTYTVIESDHKKISLSASNSLIKIDRIYELTGQYQLQAHVKIHNLGTQQVHLKIVAVTRALQNANDSGGSMFSPPLNLIESLCEQGEELQRDTLVDLQGKKEDKESMSFNNVRWLGVNSRYFVNLIHTDKMINCTQRIDKESIRLTRGYPNHLSPIVTEGVLNKGFIKSKTSMESKTGIYMGPKKLEVLQDHDPDLTQAIDFGMFSSICLPLLYMMKVFYDWFPNWGVAIILLTLLVKLLTLPLTIKQYKSMAGMKAIQPELTALKEKYQKTDPMRFQQETMGLYKKHGVNPIGGCLPMLFMMPIYFALYRTIFTAVELYQADFFAWIHDLSMPDPYYISPVILGLLMLVQARLQPNTSMDPTQRKMMTLFMPIMFGGMMLFLPSGLVLYILINTVLGIVQQNWTQKKFSTAKA
jgi:YidC/Oxa1 family membrane protein insertase